MAPLDKLPVGGFLFYLAASNTWALSCTAKNFALAFYMCLPCIVAKAAYQSTGPGGSSPAIALAMRFYRRNIKHIPSPAVSPWFELVPAAKSAFLRQGRVGAPVSVSRRRVAGGWREWWHPKHVASENTSGDRGV